VQEGELAFPDTGFARMLLRIDAPAIHAGPGVLGFRDFQSVAFDIGGRALSGIGRSAGVGGAFGRRNSSHGAVCPVAGPDAIPTSLQSAFGPLGRSVQRAELSSSHGTFAVRRCCGRRSAAFCAFEKRRSLTIPPLRVASSVPDGGTVISLDAAAQIPHGTPANRFRVARKCLVAAIRCGQKTPVSPRRCRAAGQRGTSGIAQG
jgi:hypothetical protein